VDGETNIVYEFDEIYRSAASYVDYTLTGNGIQVSYPASDWIRGINTSGITYNGIDTAAKSVMFSVINQATSTVVVRTGANNVSGTSQQRLRSLYFQKFYYPNSVLSYTPLVPSSNTTSGNDPVFKVFPSIFKSALTLKIKANKTGSAQFKLIDYGGRTLQQQDLPVKAGSNTIPIANLGNIAEGSYIVLVNVDSKVFNQKITKQ